MTEKSEDQVVWMDKNEDGEMIFASNFKGENSVPYIPQQYLNVAEAETNYFQKELEKVRSDLAKAVEALEKVSSCAAICGDCMKIGEEALGKIGGKKDDDSI